MQVQDVRVVRVESRLSEGDGSHFEVIVDCDIEREPLQELTQQLRKRVDNVKLGRCNRSALQDDGRPLQHESQARQYCQSTQHVKHLFSCGT